MTALDDARARLHYITVRDLWPEVGHPTKGWQRAVPDDVVVAAILRQLAHAEANVQTHLEARGRAEDAVRCLTDAASALVALEATWGSNQLTLDDAPPAPIDTPDVGEVGAA